jgi:hypothetical protein
MSQGTLIGRNALPLAASITAIAAWPSAALAGMPILELNDIAEMRLQSISFFIVVFLLSSLSIKLLWNWLRRDFPRLPRLTYPKALALVALWGFLFVLVLTMISGARELMTPGAWVKDGYTYRLKEDPEAAAELASRRWSRMAELKVALWAYAAAHEGQLPPDDRVEEIPPRTWESADVSRMPYLYFGRQRAGEGEAIIAVEPGVMAPPRLVLRSDGRIVQMTEEQLAAVLPRTAGEGDRRP